MDRIRRDIFCIGCGEEFSNVIDVIERYEKKQRMVCATGNSAILGEATSVTAGRLALAYPSSASASEMAPAVSHARASIMVAASAKPRRPNV